ncbi:MAG: Maf family protein [Parvularculaceae bacterium]
MMKTAAAPTQLILASGSAIRADILRAAGVPFTIAKPDVDEDAIKDRGKRAGKTLHDIARDLADAKALAVNVAAESLVLGADQIMAFAGEGFDKPKTLSEARARLLELQGRTHSLINAVSIARAGEIVFRNIVEPQLGMRAMSATEIDDYFREAGEGVLASVGAYQVENLGARLFERIEGDYFAVLGLSLFPVLGYLRACGFLRF